MITSFAVFAAVAALGQSDSSPEAQDVVGERLEGTRAEELFPFREWTHTFVVTEGDQRGEQRTVSFQPDPETPDGWIMEFTENNKAHLKRQANGDVVLYRLDELKYDRVVYLDPPLLFLPATLEPDASYTSNGAALVYESGKNGEPEEGRYSSAIERVSRHAFYTRAGKIPGYLLELSIGVDMTLVDVDVRFDYGLSPGRGLVYRRTYWALEAVDVFDRSGVRAIVLDEW